MLVDAYADENIFDAVVSDNVAGGYAATNYLLRQGHTKIAILGSQPHAFPSILERRKGYITALKEAGLTPHFWDCQLWPDSAAEAAWLYLKQQPEVTAVFACNDAVAIALLHVAQDRQCAIPSDLSVIGFDNIDLAQHAAPPLSTMRVDKAGMGRLAAQLLINRIEYPAAAPVQVLIRPQLIPRLSVASISGQ